MDFIQILSVILILWSITGTFGNQQPLLDFISYTNRASATDTGENDAGYILVGFSIIPDITEDLFIGLALSPLLDGTHYDVQPEVRSASTSSINGDISTLFDSGTTVYYTDKDTYSSFRIDFTNDQELPDRVGVFYLGAQKDGFRTAVINMPMQSQNANVRPTRSVMTASVGDATLTISVETDESSLRWRKDGGTEITDWNDIATVTITNVRLADAGLYECYVTGSRSEGLHAFIVIHVRDCPASKWSPPFCQSSCPVCYNGGICDVYLGSCLCLTGFTGDNCETSYGGNHFGFNGYVLCTANVEEKCSGKLFCGQDPIGCGCASGWKDVDCSTECESGKYGPGCMFDCHCADSDCDHSSGCNVTSVCDEGFEGERCLTPTGLQCNDGFHGVFCDLSCHCANSEACNKTDGSCPGNCEDGWAGSDCLLALPALYNAPSIELRASSVLIVWTAWNQTQDIGSAEVNSYVLKYWKLSAKDDAITINNITELQIEFNISSIEYNKTYKATVSVNTDVLGVITQGIPSPVLQFGPIEPPSFVFHPCNYARSSNRSTILTCATWNHEVHNGMGVVRGYTFEYWITDVPQDVYSIVATEPIASQHYTILLPEVANYYSYQVTVLVNYEYNGSDIVGPRSPVMNISKENIPDITGFSASFIVSNGGQTDMRSYTGTEDGVNLNVNFGVGLWVDDNGTHFGENEFQSQDGDVANSIFTTATVFTPCLESTISVRCWLKFPNSVGVRRIGVKYMSTEFNGIVVSTSMVFLAQGAPIVAEHRTISTSIGESVELVLTLDGIDDTTLRWKKDGDTADISEWDGLSHVTLGNVRRKDDGIYECYQEGHRDEGQHAIVRVIVRECPRGKWLPPNCELDCPVCYNGGVCTEFGSCICSPGFKGDNCEEACGINNWGRDCTILCSSDNPGCPRILYSLPDPYGCSCFSGYEGMECNNACDTATTGMYGPDCLIECHCDSSDCDRTEGCGEGVTCHSGYTGTTCLERDPNADCPEGLYGQQCTKICHCGNSSVCDRETGSCPNGDHCAEAWAGLGCQQALPALSEAPVVTTIGNLVNTYWSTWTLNNDYGRGSVNSYQLVFWPTNITSDVTVLNITNGIETNISWSQMNYSTQYSFAVKVVTEIDEQLVIGESSPTTNHKIYPPSLLRPPTLLSRGSLGVNITWDEWTYAFDKGIGNVTAYIVEWWDAVSAADVSTIRYTGDPSEGILIPNITYDTNVVVRIATVYINGESEKNGIPSPVLVVLKDNICPYDWKQFEDTCYLLDDSLLNWNDASSFCQEQSAHLVSITSQSESDFVVLAVQGKAYDHWIGLSFQSSSMNWYWSTGEILAYQNWQGTLDASSGACAKIDSDSGFWSNMPCQSITGNRAICKKGVQKFGCLDETWHGYKDECYKYFNNRTTRQEAAQSCRNFRTAELTSIHSLNEDEFVQTIIRSYSEDTWIGLKYRNNEVTGLQWTDETDVEYLINGINQTNIDGKCAAYSQDDHIFSWKFMDCSTENAYVCKDIRGNKHLTNLAF